MRLALRFSAIAVVACCLVPSFAAAQSNLNFLASLTGAQEVPANASTGFGIGNFVYVTDAQMVSYSVMPLMIGTPTGIHIHGPAPVGQNANVLFTLNTSTPSIGLIGPITAQQLADLRAGLWYVNVQTAAYPNGEIRGQLMDVTPVQPSSWSEIKALYAR
jgi:hypothetical protein